MKSTTLKCTKRARELRLRRLTERSYENPARPLTAKTLADAMSIHRTQSGVSVDERSALASTAVFAAVRIRAETLAVMPLKVYRRNADGGKSEARNHPAWRLLHVRPNPEMTPVVFKETMQGHVDTWGNGRAWVQHDGGGRPSALYPLDPSAASAHRDEAGELVHHVTVTAPMARARSTWREGQKVRLADSQVLHIPGLGFDGVTGYSPIAMGRESIATGLAGEQFRSKFFANGAWMSGVLEHPEALEDDKYDRLKSSWRSEHGGGANAFAPAILEEGMKWHQLTIPGDDALLLELGVFTVRDVARIYRVPLHMMADMAKGASFASIEQTSLEFVKYTLGRPMKSWEEECTRKLTGPSESLFVEFIPDSFLRGDTKGRYDAYKVGRDGGWLSINDIRTRENMSPIEGGDEYLQPLNMETVEDKPEPKPADDELLATATRTHEQLLVHVTSRLVRKECDRLKRHAGKDPEAFEAWASRFYGEHREHVVDVVHPHALALAEILAALRGTSGAEESALDAVSEWADAEVGHILAEVRMAHAAGTTDVLITYWNDHRPAAMAEALVGRLTAEEVNDAA